MIETNRLILREFQESDAQSIFINWASDSEVTKYLTWSTHQNVEVTKQILKMWLDEYTTNPHRFGIVLKNTNELIGAIDVVKIENGVPMIGYVLSRKYWNKGFMTEACNAFVNYLFDKGFEKIYIEAVDENISSNKVIEKCGFTFTHTSNITVKKDIEKTYKLNSYEKVK